MKHTQGPWEIGSPHHDNPNGERYNANCIIGADEAGVCQVYGLPLQVTLSEAKTLTDPRWVEGLANARLIAAAPELLAALKGLVEAYAAINEYPQYTREYAYALAAIAEAEGTPPC